MVRRRVLARQLKQLREEAGLTLEQAAPKLDFSVSKLSRIENAKVLIDVHWVRGMLDLYDVGGMRWTELVDLAREANQPGWWREFGLGAESMARISLPGTFYLGLEAEATLVREYTSGFVSGLMQTADYARALMQAVPIERTASQVDTLVAARTHRQHRLTSGDDQLELTAVVEESVLHRPVGGPDILRAQLRHIAALAELDTVTLRVLPTAVGAHAALASGFTILHFGVVDEPDIAYVEHALGAITLDKGNDVAQAKRSFEAVSHHALDPVESLALIRELANR
jgi:transcriptional regulator with XRE-family HTH domain